MRVLVAAHLGALLLWIAPAANSDTRPAEAAPQTPRFDPFVPAVVGAGGARGAGWSPELRSTLVGAKNSVVNLGGEILRIGEETHGYTLLEVESDQAAFTRDGQRIVLKLVEKPAP